jgi:hypothetical protein
MGIGKCMHQRATQEGKQQHFLQQGTNPIHMNFPLSILHAYIIFDQSSKQEQHFPREKKPMKSKA